MVKLWNGNRREVERTFLLLLEFFLSWLILS